MPFLGLPPLTLRGASMGVVGDWHLWSHERFRSGKAGAEEAGLRIVVWIPNGATTCSTAPIQPATPKFEAEEFEEYSKPISAAADEITIRCPARCWRMTGSAARVPPRRVVVFQVFLAGAVNDIRSMITGRFELPREKS